MKIVILIAAATLVAACSPPMKETHNWEGEFIEVRTVVHESTRDVNLACQKIIGDALERDGCAGWSLPPAKYCEIHIMRPRNQSDSHREKLTGHEFHHCLWGNYHPE